VAIYQNVIGLNWPMAAVQSILLLACSIVLVAVFSRLLIAERRAAVART